MLEHLAEARIQAARLDSNVPHAEQRRQEKERQLLAVLASTSGAAIVYVATVRRANERCERLRAQGILTERYHGELQRRERAAAQERFMSGGCRVIVAAVLPSARRLLRRAAAPIAAARHFALGQRVHHARFGSGEVLRVEADQIVVDFIRGGKRRVLANYLEPAA